MSKKPLDAMVDRFLAWPLPNDFGPDCGISFDGRKDDQWNKNKTWPIGTNLFTADQARQMLAHIVGPFLHHIPDDPDAIAAVDPAAPNGDRSVEVTAKREMDGSISVLGVREVTKAAGLHEQLEEIQNEIVNIDFESILNGSCYMNAEHRKECREGARRVLELCDQHEALDGRNK